VTSTHLRTVTAAASDVGRKRTGNEDSYDIWVADELGRDHVADTMLVVCDGMGGSNAGEVASRMAVEALVRTFAEQQGDDVAAALVTAVEAANLEVYEHSRSRPDLQGMGTTCTVAAFKGDMLALAQVGDSRAYLVRRGSIRQLTTDHSLVAQLVARKQLTPAEARTDPRRNVVTRSVGIAPVVEVDAHVFEEPLRPGDTVLVCSDGLHGLVTEDELARAASGESLDRACRELVQIANQRGGPDNITVALARVEGPPEESDDPRPRSRASASAGRRPGSKSAPPRTGGARQRLLVLLIAAFIVLVIVLCGIIFAVLGMARHPGGPSSSNANGRVEERLAWR
jgi:serine/threonine protein phosphatase PrpC